MDSDGKIGYGEELVGSERSQIVTFEARGKTTYGDFKYRNDTEYNPSVKMFWRALRRDKTYHCLLPN